MIDYEEDGCSLTTLKDAVQALLDYGMNLQITVYSGHLLKEPLGNYCDDFLRDNTDLWLAQYTSDESSISWPEGTYPAGRCTIQRERQSARHRRQLCRSRQFQRRGRKLPEMDLSWLALSAACARTRPEPMPDGQMLRSPRP